MNLAPFKNTTNGKLTEIIYPIKCEIPNIFTEHSNILNRNTVI